LNVLDDLLEPVKEYAREGAREYTSFTPLNRLVDATRPESDAAREFAGLVDQLGSHKSRIREQLILWGNNKDKVLAMMQASALLQEDIALAEDVAALAAAGLEALDYIDSGSPAPAAWAAEKRALLERAAKPRAELLIMIVPAIRTLVEAAATGKP
jgi:hexosaminidase